MIVAKLFFFALFQKLKPKKCNYKIYPSQSHKVKENLNKNGIELKEFKDQGSRCGENNKIFISSDKLKKEMNWKPNININEGISDLLSK